MEHYFLTAQVKSTVGVNGIVGIVDARSKSQSKTSAGSFSRRDSQIVNLCRISLTSVNRPQSNRTAEWLFSRVLHNECALKSFR
jgi:hypothetical protein